MFQVCIFHSLHMKRPVHNKLHFPCANIWLHLIIFLAAYLVFANALKIHLDVHLKLRLIDVLDLLMIQPSCYSFSH